ncbi:MAG: dephospho-CoA kinase [Firmicutes bacterium]|nr:dephospho-CoA kinase [Bacillota bacterium]
MSNRPAPVIVLTGGIASGKSTVAGMLAQLGAKVISADELARKVVKPGTPAWNEIIRTFGKSVLTASGDLDRRRLGALIFADEKARRALEQITHPPIWYLLKQKLQAARESTVPVVIEIPLYFEGNQRIAEAKVWVVFIDEKTQIQRLMIRDGLPEEEAKARIRVQLPLIFKSNWADQVIDNSGTKNETWAQVNTAFAAVVGDKHPNQKRNNHES